MTEWTGQPVPGANDENVLTTWTPQVRNTIDAFYHLYYNGLAGDGNIFQRTFWMGVECFEMPTLVLLCHFPSDLK